MKSKSNAIILCLAILIIAGFVAPALAGRITYNDDEPTVYYGSWESDDDATEEDINGIYRCEFQFVFTGIKTDGDNEYYVNIDYDGEEPGWLWDAESLYVHYKWGSGSWVYLCRLDIATSDKDWEINDATSSTLYLRFTDANDYSDDTLHTWKFSDTPYAICDY
ncbi:MAG: hypothetical protein R6V83_03640 [Candidatus Thorarchaeota archaeon]